MCILCLIVLEGRGQVDLWVEGIQQRGKVIKTKTYDLFKEVKRQRKG